MRLGFGKRSKYGAKKTVVDGIVFDSQKEAERFRELKLLQRAGKIACLERQKRFEIVREFREPDSIGPRGGLKKGKLIEPARYYVADFVYFDIEKCETVVEDCKGFRTSEYKLKRALMLEKYGIRVKET